MASHALSRGEVLESGEERVLLRVARQDMSNVSACENAPTGPSWPFHAFHPVELSFAVCTACMVCRKLSEISDIGTSGLLVPCPGQGGGATAQG